MEEFNTIEKVQELFRSINALGSENIFFVACQDKQKVSGMVAGISLARQLRGMEPVVFTPLTMTGGLAHHVACASGSFQPMNANFGLLEPLSVRIRGKHERYLAMAGRSLDYIEALRCNPLQGDYESD